MRQRSEKKPLFSRPRRATTPSLLVIGPALILAACCARSKDRTAVACSLVELRPRPVTRSYDAVVRLDAVDIADPLKDRFYIMTPSLSLEVSGLTFEADGLDPARLEPGDIFVIPLNRTDWRFTLEEESLVLCGLNFWDRLPPGDRWHPTLSEAMTVARSFSLANDEGFIKPVPAALPPDWRLVDEKLPTADETLGNLIYQKRRGDLILEQVDVQYAYLTEAEKEELASVPAVTFLSKWSECAAEFGQEVQIAGHPAVACDLDGVGDFGWTYRYFFVTGGVIIAVEIQADPLEWGKTEEEKEMERRTERVFLRYGYGPVGPEEWQVMIEVRMNRTGTLHKRSRTGEEVVREFAVTDGEFAEIASALEANGFFELESRSGRAGGSESFISVAREDGTHTVRVKNFRLPPYEAISGTLRRILLPKAGEDQQNRSQSAPVGLQFHPFAD